MSEAISVKRRMGSMVSMLLLSTALGACSSGEGPEAGESDASMPAATTKPTLKTTLPDTPPDSVFATGAQLYVTHCAMCHGQTGQGDGALGASLNPPPRALVGEPWRYIEGGTPETEKVAIVGLLKKGVPGSAMPTYGSMLSTEDLTSLAEYVLSIREER